MNDIAIYGAGGFGREVLCLINAINAQEKTWNFVGFFDDGILPGTKISDYDVLGGIEKLNACQKEMSIVVAIGKPQTLKCIVDKINNPNIDFPNIIAPDVLFMDKSRVHFGHGNIITFKSLISTNVKYGNFNILNCDVFLGHDVVLGSYNILNPSSRISGCVHIGNCNLIGVSSIVLQGKKIGNNTTIAANSVVMRNTKDNNLYIGNPATIMKI